MMVAAWRLQLGLLAARCSGCRALQGNRRHGEVAQQRRCRSVTSDVAARATSKTAPHSFLLPNNSRWRRLHPLRIATLLAAPVQFLPATLSSSAPWQRSSQLLPPLLLHGLRVALTLGQLREKRPLAKAAASWFQRRRVGSTLSRRYVSWTAAHHVCRFCWLCFGQPTPPQPSMVSQVYAALC